MEKPRIINLSDDFVLHVYSTMILTKNKNTVNRFKFSKIDRVECYNNTDIQQYILGMYRYCNEARPKLIFEMFSTFENCKIVRETYEQFQIQNNSKFEIIKKQISEMTIEIKQLCEEIKKLRGEIEIIPNGPEYEQAKQRTESYFK